MLGLETYSLVRDETNLDIRRTSSLKWWLRSLLRILRLESSVSSSKEIRIPTESLPCTEKVTVTLDQTPKTIHMVFCPYTKKVDLNLDPHISGPWGIVVDLGFLFSGILKFGVIKLKLLPFFHFFFFFSKRFLLDLNSKTLFL